MSKFKSNPLTPETYHSKLDFEGSICESSFEDPEVGDKKPGEKLTETPAAMFSRTPTGEIKKPELPEDSFPIKRDGHYIPSP